MMSPSSVSCFALNRSAKLARTAREDGQRLMVTMGIRYLDVVERSSGGWVISRHNLVFDWTDRRPSQAAT